MISQVSPRIRRYAIYYPLVFFTFLLLAATLGFAVAYQSYAMVLLLFSPILMFVVLESNVIPILIILFVCFFGNSLEELGLVPPQFNWIAELLAGLLFVKAVAGAITQQRINTSAMWIVLAFLGITLASSLYNYTHPVSGLLFLRSLFRYYLLFLAVMNLDFDEDLMRFINGVLVFLLIIQIPTAVVKLFIYGQGEQAIGTYATYGGTPSTVLPLVAIGFLLPYYLLYRRSKLYIVLAFGSIAFSIIGKKKGFIFFLPIMLAYLSWHLRNEIANLPTYMLVSGLVLASAVYFGFRAVPRLNPEEKVWGTFDPIHAVRHTYEYTTSGTEQYSAGRTATTVRTFRQLRNAGLPRVLFGFGPGYIMKSIVKGFSRRGFASSELGMRYGITGLNWIALQSGYLGAFLYFLLVYVILRRCARYFAEEADPYWRAFGIGMVAFSFAMIFINLLYAPICQSDLFPPVYFLLAGFIMKRMEILANDRNARSAQIGAW